MKNIEFLKNWSSELDDIKFILKYLETYPDLLDLLAIESLIKEDEIIGNQDEWVTLCNKYTGKEKDFFKEYWVPLEINEWEFFIDISDSNYPVISHIYTLNEKQPYVKTTLFKSINQLMLIKDQKENFEILKENIKSLSSQNSKGFSKTNSNISEKRIGE